MREHIDVNAQTMKKNGTKPQQDASRIKNIEKKFCRENSTLKMQTKGVAKKTLQIIFCFHDIFG